MHSHQGNCLANHEKLSYIIYLGEDLQKGNGHGRILPHITHCNISLTVEFTTPSLPYKAHSTMLA
jgi:hypothetical protein